MKQKTSFPPLPEFPLLTKQEFARGIRKTTRSVEIMINRREIKFLRIGGSVRFHPDAASKYLKSRTVHAA